LGKFDEISSTEKLLGVIRGENNAKSSQNYPEPKQPIPSPGLILQKSLPFKKIVVGVDIGEEGLKLSKIIHYLDKKQALKDYLTVPYDEPVSEFNNKFADFLKSALTGFVSQEKHVEIWSSFPASEVHTRYLTIPVVSKKQRYNAILWKYKKEISYNNSDNSVIFDYRILGDTIEEGIKKLKVIAYTAPRKDVLKRAALFAQIEFPLTGLTIFPFAIQNLFKCKWNNIENTVSSILISKDWSRIDIFHSSGDLVLTREIKTGINSMIEAIRDEIYSADLQQSNDTNKLELTNDSMQTKTVDTEDDSIFIKAKQLLEDFIYDSFSSDALGKEISYSEEDIFNIILTVLDRLIKQMERTFEHFFLKYKKTRVDKIYVIGEINTCKPLMNYIEKQLGISVKAADPFEERATSMSPKYAHMRSSFTLAIGLGLSKKSSTPNLIFTQKDKQKYEFAKRARLSAVIFFLITAFAGITNYMWQGICITEKQKNIITLENKLKKIETIVDKNLLLQSAIKINNKKKIVELYAEKYFGIAIIRELSRVTPANIKLLNMKAEFEKPLKEKKIDRIKKKEIDRKTLTFDGIIRGDKSKFETSLAGYIVNLNSSQLFANPVLKKKSIETFKDNAVLFFTILINMG